MNRLIRRPTWRADLGAWLVAHARQSFRPGAHDCALFAASAIEVMTGTDLAAEWRGTYRTLKAGQSALEAAGYSDHVALAAALLPEIPPALAGVGDLAVLPGEGGTAAFGIVQGENVYALAPNGLVVLSRMHIERAFRV